MAPKVKRSASENLPIPVEMIERRIFLIRGHKVMLDADLADLYGVETFNLNKAVKRNLERFPEDFMFQLTREEAHVLTFQIGISKPSGRGGRRSRPYAFTEHGVAQLSTVLRSKRAIQINLAIIRAFIHLRRNKRLTAIEKKLAAHEKSLVVVFLALDKLKHPPRTNAVGFETKPRRKVA